MAYRFDKATSELVIDGWENGIAASPYKGIANIKNVNTSYYSGVSYVNYRRQACAITGGTMTAPVSKAISPAGLIYIQDDTGQIWKQSAVNSSSFALLDGGSGRIDTGASGIAYWNNYLVVFGLGLIEFCGDGTGDAAIISTNWNINNTSTGVASNSAVVSTSYIGSPTQIYLVAYAFLRYPKFKVNDPITFTTTGTLPAGISAGTTYYILSIIDMYTITISTTVGGSAVSFTSNGTGVLTMKDMYNPIPIGTYADFQFTYSGAIVGSTRTVTISSYYNTHGTLINSGTWQEPTGTYQIVLPGGGFTFAVFTNGSGTVTFSPPAKYLPPGTYSIRILDPSVVNYRPYVSRVDGNLYFANGRYLGRILAQNTDIPFNPAVSQSYVVNYGTSALLKSSDTITDLTDLSSKLIITGQRDIYTWDYTSASASAPVPVGEPIKRIANVMNNIYILAGEKGSIYVSNGYSAQLLTRLPDFISGVVDPVWSWGDLMFHRSKLFVQAIARNTTGTNLLAGIFSLIISPSILGEQASGLTMESQNSYGLIPAVGSTNDGLLIDNEPSSDGRDSYYSAWSNGLTALEDVAGGIDYNNTTCWQNYEPSIETDIIPIGTLLDKKTMGAIQFKLDRPMVSGDSIKLYCRPSLSDTYTLIGTTTTAQLSEYFPSNVMEAQWVQFRIDFKCSSSGSSRMPLKEIRVQIK